MRARTTIPPRRSRTGMTSIGAPKTHAISVYSHGARGNMSIVIGWDIGGVHLKAARAETGCVVQAIQIAAPLRAGVERLAEAFARAKAELGAAQRHVVTMTGELADTFSSRQEGVECLAMLAARELNVAPVFIYPGRGGDVL